MEQNLITLTTTLPEPKLAADVANFVAQKALELNASLKQTDPLSTKEHIQRQHDQAKKKIDSAYAALVNFKRTAGLRSLRYEQDIFRTEKQRLARLYSDYTIQLKDLQAAVSELSGVLTTQAAAQERGATDAPRLAEMKIVYPAITPTAPRGRKVIRSMALAATAAFVATTILAFLLEYLEKIKRRRKKLTGVVSS